MKSKRKSTKPKTDAELAFEQAKREFDIAKSIFQMAQAYEKSSPAQRRVMIAEDALLQLKMKKFVTETGIYVDAKDLADEASLEQEVQLNKLLHDKNLKSSCNV